MSGISRRAGVGAPVSRLLSTAELAGALNRDEEGDRMLLLASQTGFVSCQCFREKAVGIQLHERLTDNVWLVDLRRGSREFAAATTMSDETPQTSHHLSRASLDRSSES